MNKSKLEFGNKLSASGKNNSGQLTMGERMPWQQRVFRKGLKKNLRFTREQLEKVGASYRLYSLIFPIYWILSRLDYLLPFTEGYCVLIAGRRDS